MGKFLVIAFASHAQDNAERLFHAGLQGVRRLTAQTPSGVVETVWVRAASFARHNGSGTPIVVDPDTGSWLLAIGTWFHTDNYASGAEARLLRRYLEVGAFPLSRELEGFYVVVLGDARTQETLVITDIAGSCHGFMRIWNGQGIALADSSLLLASLGEVSLDTTACQEFLRTGVIYEDRTLYQEVRKLGPATVFRLIEGTLRSAQRYWQIMDLTPESLDGQAAVRMLGDTLVRAAERVGRTFARPVCDLTGGYDSRTLVAAFLTAGVQFGTTVSGSIDSHDVLVSRGLAQRVDLPHLHVEPRGPVSLARVKAALPLTDGEYDLVEYSRVMEIHHTLAERFDISINGSFGELARGYWWELLFPRAGAYQRLDAHQLARRRYAVSSGDNSLFAPDVRLDLVAHFAAMIERTNAGLSSSPNTLQMDHTYLAMRMQRWQGRIASSTNHVWPGLSPFLFRSVLETVLQATTRSRRHSLLVRRVLAALQPRLAEWPLEHGHPAVPVTWRNVYRFWPVPVHVGMKVVAKVISRLGGRGWGTPSRHLGRPPARLHLWQDEYVRELLQPATMRLSRGVDATALRSFLEYSQAEDFPWDAQWARVLSLEYALRVLEGLSRDV